MPKEKNKASVSKSPIGNTFPIDLDVVPNGHRKPVECCKRIHLTRLWRDRSASSQLVFD